MICVNSVNVYPSRIAIKTGTWYYNVHAEVCPTNATCPNVTWSSSDPSIAIVHPTSGYIHGGRPGTATIYATATDGSGRRGCCTVTVSQRIYVNSITLNTFQISIQRNNNYLLTAEVCPSNADNKAINWCSSNTEVATVSGGRVYAHKKGAAVITAAAADGSGTEAKCYVNVTENYLVVLITVEPACKTLAVGESVFLRETVYPNHATNKEVCWSSSNEYVATVNPTSGFVAAKHAGTATIYATAQDGSGKRGCCQITVIPPVHVTGITLCPQEQSMNVGQCKKLQATVLPANATNQSVTWHSSNPNVATVGTYTGQIDAKLAGTTTITATSVDGGFQASCALTINQVLTGADVYITDENIIQTIINAKNLSDVAYDMYLSGDISCDQLVQIKQSAQYAADLARADFIVVNDQSDFAYQYFRGRNYQNGDITPFTRELFYDEENPQTGLDVMVIQRGMQAIGYFEPEESYKYGTYDLETHQAAKNNQVFPSDVFDNLAYREIFNASTSENRTPQWLINLQEYSRQHRLTQLAVAGKVAANIEVPIAGGGPSGIFPGRADVLRNQPGTSKIWEIKHSNPNNLQLGNNQLQRYIDAARAHPQNFVTPLSRGDDFSTFYIKYTPTTCLEISSTSIKGLVFYREISTPSPAPSVVPVPIPQSQKEYEFQLKPIPLGTVVAVGVAILLIAGSLFFLFTTGDLSPLEQSLRTFGQAIGFA